MKRILLFAGTTEGRKLAELLAGAGINAIVCVATEYGEEVLTPLSGITVRRGRMDSEEMRKFMGEEEFLAVVDATHPFAVEASENIRKAAKDKALPYLRLQRDTGAKDGEAKFFSDHAECVLALAQTEGNILLTIGSKELKAYCDREELRERLFVRVLPSEESIALCREQGLSGRQIIAMQGPFLEEMNLALIRQYKIRVMVSKESGAQGGFEEKAAAAKRQGISFFVISNPERQQGMSFREVCDALERLTGRKLGVPVGGNTGTDAVMKKTDPLSLSLIGIGMGSKDSLTVEARDKIEKADCLFGARRVLDRVLSWLPERAGREVYPYYLAEDILPFLESESPEGPREIAVLFSGDSGFYSGSSKLYRDLESWREQRKREISLRVYPGISAVSYFAAALGVSWQDGKIVSIHGRGERRTWEAEVLSAIRYQKKVFLLVSGVRDVRAVGEILRGNMFYKGRLMLGYQLSCPEEEILECTPEQCVQAQKEGMYILAFLREEAEERYLLPWRRDEEFIRGKVPMSKENIRELAICKLRLTERAVVCDIGSGSGSVAVEIAERSPEIRVLAVERGEEAIGLIRRNKEKFRLPNIEIVEGEAPDCMRELPDEISDRMITHAFIGGSGGRLGEILELLYQKNPNMRIVLTAISLETVCEMMTTIEAMPIRDKEILQVQVSRAKKAGGYHLMQAENPVYLCSFEFCGERAHCEGENGKGNGRKLPGVMIAATGSGAGKTTVTCALLEILRERGLQPCAFKCGPDYIDPMFHREVLGLPSRNLDSFFSDGNQLRQIYEEGGQGRKIAVVEGAMGLFDGLGGIREKGSAYQTASILQLPILLVVDARGMGGSVLALLSGFRQYDRERRIAGVILNRISERFYQSLAPVIEKELGIAVLGFLPENRELTIESRHLGLKLPGEIAKLQEKVCRTAEILEKNLSVDKVLEIAAEGYSTISGQGRSRQPRELPGHECGKEAASIFCPDKAEDRVRIGVARDEAFCFYYEENLRLLEQKGAELIFFSPLHDRELPEDLDALLLGGGYPELYAGELEQNSAMRQSVKEAIERGMPSVAECGGFLYLHRSLEDEQGRTFAMCGVVPGKCFYTGKSIRFGYIELREKQANFLNPGGMVKGHEFHYYESEDKGQDCLAVKPVTGKEWDCVHGGEDHFWGFPHLYYPSNPDFVVQFIGKAKAFRNQRERAVTRS